jgi:hypothetical protein
VLQGGPHLHLLGDAIALEARGQRALLNGDEETGRRALLEAADRYRASWEVAPPGSYGRLIGALKASIIAGDPADAAAYVSAQLPEPVPGSPTAAYVCAIAALVRDDDAAAAAAAEGMRAGSPAFARAADAIVGIATRDEHAYAAAVHAIVADFEARDAHLTGVPFADTALMLERLAQPRGLAIGPISPLLPVGQPHAG